MPPAAPDDLIRQYSQSLEGNSSIVPDKPPTIPEYEPSGKSKKKKSGKKAKAARAATETPPDDLTHASAPPPPEPSSCPEPTADHYAPQIVTSPILDVLDSVEQTTGNDLNSRTDDWAQSVPFGKSPPKDLMDEELSNEAPLHFPTIQERGGFSQPSSASPPTRIRPSSYSGGHRSSMQSRQQSVDRRTNNSYGSPMNNLAPPPHMPQAHFYGAPEIDLSNQDRVPTDAAYSFCAFDNIPSLSAKAARSGTNVLLVGMDGALDVYAVEHRRTRLIGQISGLNGRVLEAKILFDQPTTESTAPRSLHVAMIVHGPLVPNEEEGRLSSAGSEANEVPASTVRGASNDSRIRRNDKSFYQTRVEIYSLRTGQSIATLFASKPVPVPDNLPGLPSLAPPPVGNLKVFNSSQCVIVASGVSGELYIFNQASSGVYQCLGKTWTTVQTGETRRYSNSSSSTDADSSHNDASRTTILERPIMAVHGRWLAVVPPSSTYRTSIQGVVPGTLLNGKVHGIETRSAPTMPSVNCATDVGDGESFFDKVARGVTQELVKGARWMGDQGLQAWNNYWNHQQSPGTPPQRPLRNPETETQAPRYGLFPPTHAQDTQAVSSPEPDTVSIIDLKKFESGTDMKSSPFNPVATFQVPNGCSFLSLSPNGLMLFTASKKGDVQYVWDLMQLRHRRAMAFMADEQSSQTPSVRQIARYARLTTSSIVDVIWTPPIGDRLAVITRKGTVHVFDLPRSAFQWPPFRRARPIAKQSPNFDSKGEDLSGQESGGNPLSAAMKLVGGKTQPFFSAARGRVPSSGAAFPNMAGFTLPSTASIQGGKVMAAGISKSMGAAATGTVHTLRHVGENRLHLSGLARDPAPSRVTWISQRGVTFLGVLDDGLFKLYRVKQSPTSHKNRQFHSVIGAKESQYKLPANLQSACGPAPLLAYDAEAVVRASLLLPSVNSQQNGIHKPFCQPLSQAEIETNTPYQPFHTDHRVGLHVFSADANSQTVPVPDGQWIFGGDIPITKVHVRSYGNSHDEPGEEEENHATHGHSFGAGGDMENLITLGNSTGNVEEVVITTRRKKKHTTPLKAEDGFFEDDCEVLDFARDRV